MIEIPREEPGEQKARVSSSRLFPAQPISPSQCPAQSLSPHHPGHGGGFLHVLRSPRLNPYPRARHHTGVYIEHLVYSAALAVLVGMVFVRYTGRDPSWIIIFVAFLPDFDEVGKTFLARNGLFSVVVHHGDFHNLANLLIASLIFAWLLHFAGMHYFDGFVCTAIGFGAHFFADALVANPAYAFFWPLSSQKYGIGLLPETGNFFGIGDTTILLIGLFFLAVAIGIRTYVEGNGWGRTFFRMGIEKIK